eukprot:TRINITY_DN6579_c0_g1_i1.p1 TRINITY_DN6579_c0_g1~~TRINITY_DN6579_c0_g1_i1.p1  ORF type:complete len:1345 (+),score=240.29 TRINITY_DN6579_c0_g1_i1:73-4107(+)
MSKSSKTSGIREVGDDVTMHCSGTSGVVSLCRWKTPYHSTYIVGQGIYVERGRIQWRGKDPRRDCSIRISSLEMRDAGVWTCEIGFGGDGTKDIILQKKDFRINIETPLKLSTPTILTENNQATLVCHANKEFDDCKWKTPYGSSFTFKNSQSSHEGGRISFYSFRSSKTDCGIMIQRIEPKDNGEWVCQVEAGNNGKIHQNASEVLFVRSNDIVEDEGGSGDYSSNIDYDLPPLEIDAFDYVNGDFDKVTAATRITSTPSALNIHRFRKQNSPVRSVILPTQRTTPLTTKATKRKIPTTIISKLKAESSALVIDRTPKKQRQNIFSLNVPFISQRFGLKTSDVRPPFIEQKPTTTTTRSSTTSVLTTSTDNPIPHPFRTTSVIKSISSVYTPDKGRILVSISFKPAEETTNEEQDSATEENNKEAKRRAIELERQRQRKLDKESELQRRRDLARDRELREQRRAQELAERKRIEERKRLQEEKRKLLEEETQKRLAEEELKKKEDEARLRKIQEEDRLRRLHEAQRLKKIHEEEAEKIRRKKEEEDRLIRLKKEEEDNLQKIREENERRRQILEEERLKRIKEEKDRSRRAREEERRLRRMKEEEERRQKAKEAERRKEEERLLQRRLEQERQLEQRRKEQEKQIEKHKELEFQRRQELEELKKQKERERNEQRRRKQQEEELLRSRLREQELQKSRREHEEQIKRRLEEELKKKAEVEAELKRQRDEEGLRQKIKEEADLQLRKEEREREKIIREHERRKKFDRKRLSNSERRSSLEQQQKERRQFEVNRRQKLRRERYKLLKAERRIQAEDVQNKGVFPVINTPQFVGRKRVLIVNKERQPSKDSAPRRYPFPEGRRRKKISFEEPAKPFQQIIKSVQMSTSVKSTIREEVRRVGEVRHVSHVITVSPHQATAPKEPFRNQTIKELLTPLSNKNNMKELINSKTSTSAPLISIPVQLPNTEKDETKKDCVVLQPSNGNITCSGSSSSSDEETLQVPPNNECRLACDSGYVSLEKDTGKCYHGHLSQRLECVKPDALLILGGRSDTYGVLNTAELITAQGVCRGAVPPFPAMRWKLVLTSIGRDKVLACGGAGQFGDSKGDCWLLEFSPLPTWKEIQSMGIPRDSAAVAYESSKVYVLGGSLGKLNGYTDVVDVFDPVKEAWENHGIQMTSPRHSHCAVGLGNGSILVTGGYGGLSLTERYDIQDKKWTQLPELNPVRAQHGCALVDLHGEQGVIIVGGDSGGTRLGDVRFLSLSAAPAWRKISELNTARWGRPGVGVVGGRITVSAGWSGFRDLDTVEYYNEATSSWRLTASKLQTERRWPYSTPISLSLFPKCIQKRTSG